MQESPTQSNPFVNLSLTDEVPDEKPSNQVIKKRISKEEKVQSRTRIEKAKFSLLKYNSNTQPLNPSSPWTTSLLSLAPETTAFNLYFEESLRSISAVVDWIPLPTTSLDSFDLQRQFWESIKELPSQMQWANLASYILHYIVGGDPSAQEIWSQLMTNIPNDDILVLHDWLMSRSEQSLKFGPNQEWDVLDSQIKLKYAELRQLEVKNQLTEAILKLFVTRLEGISFEDDILINLHQAGTFTLLNKSWMMDSLHNNMLTSITQVQDPLLTQSVEVNRRTWLENHLVFKNKDNQLQTRNSMLASYNLGNLPSVNEKDLVFDLLREFTMINMTVTEDDQTSIQKFKSKNPCTEFSNTVYSSPWKIWSMMNPTKIHYSLTSPSDLQWTNSTGISSLPSNETGFIMLSNHMQILTQLRRETGASPRTKIQLSLHPLKISNHERYPALLTQTWKLTNEANSLLEKPCSLTFDLNDQFKMEGIQSMFLIQQFFENKGSLCMDSMMTCTEYKVLESIKVTQRFEGLKGEKNLITFYLWALFMYGNTKAELKRLTDSAYTDLVQHKIGSRQVLKIIRRDGKYDGVEI